MRYVSHCDRPFRRKNGELVYGQDYFEILKEIKEDIGDDIYHVLYCLGNQYEDEIDTLYSQIDNN